MKPNKVIIHIHANHVERYLGYAVMCVWSLIHNGSVPPKQIHVLVNEEWSGHENAVALHKMGVTVEFRMKHNILGKFVQMDEYFLEYDCNIMLVKLDADTILTEKCDFIAKCIELMSRGSVENSSVEVLYGCYRQFGVKPQQIQQQRFGLINIPALSPKEEYGRVRLNNLIRGTYFISIDQYRNWLGEQSGWWYGGMIIVNQKMTTLPVWRALVCMSGMTACDETCMALARSQSRPHHIMDAPFAEFSQRVLPHVVNPQYLENSIGLFTTGGCGMIHYAGEWYRYENQENRALLEGFLKWVKESL